jgi:hypothetical protein
MKIARKLYLGSAVLFLSAMLTAGVAKVRADSDTDDEANYGVRGNRITSNCVVNGGVLVIPQVPPPPTTPTPDPCNGLVTPLINIPSANNRWSVDISWFNPETQKLYLADRNNKGVDIIDTKTNTVVGLATGFVGITPLPPLPNTTANAAGPNGILVTNNPHQLWAGDGTGDIRVYSLDNKGTSPALLKIISHLDPAFVALRGPLGAQRRADELAYDPDDQLILMAWDDDLDLFVALVRVSSNPNNINVVKTISFKTPNCPAFGGCATAGIEQPVYDHDSNRFYIAIPASTGHPNGEIVRINPKTMAVDGDFDTTGTAPAAGVPCFPHGLTLGPRQNLLLGCSGDGATGTQMISIIMKATTGQVLQTFNQLGGSDEVYYDKGNNTYFLAMSSWTSSGKTGTGNPTPSLGIIDAGSADTGNEAPAWIQNILTTRTSHSVAAGYGFRCDFDDHGRSDCGRHEPNEGNDVVRKFAYVPLTIVPVPLVSGTPPTPQTLSETGGIGIYGRLP